MSVIVSLGLCVFEEKIDDFESKRLKFQQAAKKYPKRKNVFETQETF